MKQLFLSFERAFSAGCVRLESFLNVAAWVLEGNDGWTRERIVQAIAAGERPTLRVPQPVPVHFIYLTAWVDRGAINFRNDLYNRDNQAFQQDAQPQTGALPATVAP